jgi:hypothetical protein
VALVLGVFTAVVATICQSYWDLVVDWGLLRARARHAWLRDQLILKREWVYFVAMVRLWKSFWCSLCGAIEWVACVGILFGLAEIQVE